MRGQRGGGASGRQADGWRVPGLKVAGVEMSPQPCDRDARRPGFLTLCEAQAGATASAERPGEAGTHSAFLLPGLELASGV